MALSQASTAKSAKENIEKILPEFTPQFGIELKDIPEIIYVIKKLSQEQDYKNIVRTVQSLMVALEKKSGARLTLDYRKFLLGRLLEIGRCGEVKVEKIKIIFTLVRYSPRLFVTYFEPHYFAAIFGLFLKIFYVPFVRRRLESYKAFEARNM